MHIVTKKYSALEEMFLRFYMHLQLSRNSEEDASAFLENTSIVPHAYGDAWSTTEGYFSSTPDTICHHVMVSVD